MTLNSKLITNYNPIIFALDVPDIEIATYYIDLLKDHVGMFKVGTELFVKAGPRIIDEIRKRCDHKIFLDLKIYDVPTTIERTVRNISALDVYMTSVCAKNHDHIKAAHEGSTGGVNVLIIASFTNELIPMGYLKIAKIANDEACFGVVCSGLEVFHIKQAFSGLLAVVPGIRQAKEGDMPNIREGFEDSMIQKNVRLNNKDHKRVVTPEEAIYYGADYMVIGRPIRDAEDPVAAVYSILENIKGDGDI